MKHKTKGNSMMPSDTHTKKHSKDIIGPPNNKLSLAGWKGINQSQQGYARRSSKQILNDSNRKNEVNCIREQGGLPNQNAEGEYPHLKKLKNTQIYDDGKNIFPLAIEGLYIPSLTIKSTMSNPDKARMVREINLKIQLLESKSKQPGAQLQDLVPLRQEIYNKFDQYYITNKLGISRFVEKDVDESTNQKNTAFPSRIRKGSKVLSSKNLKSQSRTSSPQSSVSRSSSFVEKPKPFSSKVLQVYQEDKRVNCKTYKTMANISTVSLTHRSNNEQEEARPIFQTELSEQQMIELDREPQRKMSELSQEHHESYVELKENVRIMEERIGFLIHRLEQNRKEINCLKESKERFEKRCYEKEVQNIKLNESQAELTNNLSTLQSENKRLRQRFEQIQRENNHLEKQSLSLEKSISQMTNEIEYLSQKLKMKENEFNLLEELLINKKSECEELGHNFRSLQRQFAKKRKEMLSQIEQKQHEKEKLKGQLKQQKARMEVEGINFKFQEATKLKKYIEENELLHQREIQKIDSSYSSVINTFEEENRRIKNQKVQLENALIQWLGSYSKLEKSQNKAEDTQFKSQLIKLQAIGLKVGQFPGSYISRQFQQLLQNYSQLQRQKNIQLKKNQQLQKKWQLFKEEYENMLEKQCENEEYFKNTLEQQHKIMTLITSQKEQLLSELKLKKKRDLIAENKQSVRIFNMKINSKNHWYRYPQPQLAMIDNGASFQKVMEKMTKVPLKRKLEIGLKLIDLAQSFVNRKKLPTLNPNCLTVSYSQEINDLNVQVNPNIKEQQDQNLHYCSPEVLLGFNETHQSHCWTIGIILDKLIHGKEFFTQYSQIISRRQNYLIRDERYKSLTFLADMLRKNQRQRISLDEVRSKILIFLSISQLQ